MPSCLYVPVLTSPVRRAVGDECMPFRRACTSAKTHARGDTYLCGPDQDIHSAVDYYHLGGTCRYDGIFRLASGYVVVAVGGHSYPSALHLSKITAIVALCSHKSS